MRAIVICAISALSAWVCVGQTQSSAASKAAGSKSSSSATKSAAPSKGTTAKPAATSSTAAHKSTTAGARPAAGATTAKTTGASTRKTTARKPSTVRRAYVPRQSQPSTDRYHEIQNALVAKGYLPPEQASGVWDQNSVDAMKRFQADQKLDSSGKITSMSLIALGLGPKHDPATVAPAAPANQ